MSKNNNENEERDEKSLLLRFKNFVKRNSIRIKAGAAATIVAGSIGFAAINLGKDDTSELSEPTSSQEQIDPTYNPEDDDSQNTIIPGPGPSETETPSEDDEHNHEQETNNQTQPGNDTEKPVQGTDEVTETPIHNHTFSEWEALNDTDEVRTCSCGEKEIRHHSLTTPTTTYEIGLDDTHTVTTTERCMTCDYEKTTSAVENCEYIITNYDETYEYKTCKDCGKEVKHHHTLDEGILNEDGTTTFNCINEGCNYVKIKEKDITPPISEEHIHNYTDPVITYTSVNENGHVKVYTKTCTEEGCPNPYIVEQDPQIIAHVYGQGVNGIDPETGKRTVTYTCKDCGYKKIQEKHIGTDPVVEHTHNYNGEATISYEQTDNGHVKVYTYTCIDPNCPNVNEKGIIKSDEIQHNYDREHGVISEDGKSITYSCECGKTITENLVHTHTYGEPETTYENITNTNHTKVLTKTCTECQEQEISKTKTGHNFIKVKDTTQNGVEGTLYACECGKEKFVEKTITPPIVEKHQHTFSEEAFARYENLTDTHHTKVYVKTCTDSNCTTPGGEKEEREVTSTHNFIKTDNTQYQNNITYEIWECECGKTKLVEKSQTETHTHTYGEPYAVYENNDGTHTKIMVKKCTDSNCANPIFEISRESGLTHTYTKTDETREIDGVLYNVEKCECGKEHLVEKTQTETHTHNYDGTPVISYEKTDTGHIKVYTYTCTDPNCTNISQTKVEKDNEVQHSYDRTNGNISEDGTTITYSCECGKTITENYSQPPVTEHKYIETGEERTIYDENGHQKVKVLKCSIENCPDHQEKTEPIEEKEEHTYTTVSETDPETGITTITSTCSCGHTKTETKNPEVKDPEKIDIASLITIDKTTFTYNGTDQHPNISGLPEGVTANYTSTPGVNAGEYTWHITFTTPEGYTADPIDINYTIEPANVTLNYEYKDGKVEATYSNILPEDILNTSYKINGEDVGTGATLDKAGLQTVESTIEIDPEKLGNYNLSDTLNQSATYNVKNQNNWFELDTDYNVNEDGTITVNISLSTDKIPYYEENGITAALSFNLYFDTEKLEYNDEFINGDEWTGGANPDNFNNPVIDGEKYGVSTVGWFETRDDVQGVNVCSLTFTPKNQDDKDIIIKIDDIFYGNYTGIKDEWGDDILPFAFTNGPSYCIINPTNPIETITINNNNNLLDDVIYSYEDNYDEEDKAKSLEILKECMENGYQIPEKYIQNEDEFEDEEEYTEEDLDEETEEDIEEETLEEDNLESATTDEEETTTETTKDEDTDTETDQQTDQTDDGETDTEENTEDTGAQEIEEGQSYEFEIEAIEESEDNQTNEDDSPKTYQKTL